MANIITEIIAPQSTFEGVNNIEKLSKLFTDLYRIDIYKDGLDLILTKLWQKHLIFEIKIIKDWDTNIGCFLTTKQGFFDRAFNKVFYKKDLKIILRQLSYNVLAHEMAHAVDFESGINLNEDFRKCIALDMKNSQNHIITLKAESQRLMIDQVKKYPANQFLNELFARYFELLSISRDVCQNGDFTTLDVMNYFANTTKFIAEILNPQIKKQINQNISIKTLEIAKNIKISNPQTNFSQKTESFHKRVDNNGKKSWSQNTKSNNMYQQGWNKYKGITEE